MICIDLEEQIKYIAELTMLDYDLARKYVYAEDRYYNRVGLTVSSEEELEDTQVGFIDESELIKSISKETGMDLDICERFCVSTTVYAFEIGLLSPTTFTSEDVAFIKNAVKIPNFKKGE